MSSEVKELMEGKSIHWTQEGLCRGDGRFTGRKEWIAYSDLLDMRAMCAECPVFDKCRDWAVNNGIDVFAAGVWWPDVSPGED